MSILQTIDLKKFYGTDHIVRIEIDRIAGKSAAGGKNCQDGSQEVTDYDMAF